MGKTRVNTSNSSKNVLALTIALLMLAGSARARFMGQPALFGIFLDHLPMTPYPQ